MSWWSFPLVEAYGEKQEKIQFKVSEEFVAKLFDSRKWRPIFQLHAHVCGQVPPIPHSSRLLAAPLPPKVTELSNARACFKGVRRAYDDDAWGSSVLIYVVDVQGVTVRHQPSMTCQAETCKVPADWVLTVHVRHNSCLHESGVSVEGCVTWIEFVRCDEENLPRDYGSRYEQMLWCKKNDKL